MAAVASSRRQEQQPASLLPQATWDHIRSHIYEAQHFPARLISRLSEISALRVDVVAQLLAVAIVLALFVPELAPIVAALLLIGYPIAITYFHPEERTFPENLLVYWACYALLTFFDRYLEPIPGYYVLKVALLALLFLEPWRLVESLKKATTSWRLSRPMFDKSELETLSKRNKRSPRPETLEEEQALVNSTKAKPTELPVPKIAKPEEPMTAIQTISSVATTKPANANSAISVQLEQKPLTKKWLSPGRKMKAMTFDLNHWTRTPPSVRDDSAKTAIDDEDRGRIPGISRESAMLSPACSRCSTARSRDDSEKLSTAKDPGSSQRSQSAPPRQEKQSPPSSPLSTFVPVYREPPSDENKPAATPTRTARFSSNADVSKPMPATSSVDLANHERFRGVNPMTVDSSYRLDPTGEEQPPPAARSPNPSDLEFFPSHQLVFNTPFDFDHVTYHMVLRNSSQHSIAFAIKGNAVPRILAYPPSGIIQSGQTMLIGVTVQKFDWNPYDFNRDRICFEYVLLKEELSDVVEFSQSLFQNSDLKRRRNIYIKYNV